MLIRDGIVIGSDLDDPDTVRAHIRDVVTRVLDATCRDGGVEAVPEV